MDYHPQARAKFQFELRPTPTKSIAFNGAYAQHVSSTIVDTINGACTCRHQFLAAQPDVVDSTLKSFMPDGNPFVRYRVGLVTDSTETWLPWQEHQIVSYAAVPKGIGDNSGHNFEIHTSDRLYTLNRQTKIGSHRGTISDIVARIADAAGLKATVEPTKGTFSYIQTQQSDVEFVQNRLLLRAINLSDRGQYALYIRDNTLHFHTPDYQSTLHTLPFYSVPHNSATLADHSQQLWSEGAAGVYLLSYDPYTGLARIVQSDPEHHLKLSTGIYRLDSVSNGQQVIPYHLGTNDAAEALALAQSTYNNGRASTFEAKLEIIKNISIRHGDLINFSLAQQEAKVSPWSGYYLVVSVVRHIAKEALRTTFTLKRGEIQKDATVNTQNSGESLVPVTAAPGQALNVASISASSLTANRGTQDTFSSYISTKEPNNE